ncbi:unnamed protein product [Withania somnifera]
MASINISFHSTSLSRSQALKTFKLFNGLQPSDLCSVNVISSESFKRLNARAHLTIKNEFKISSAFLSGEGDVHSQSRGESSLFSSFSTGTETQPDAVAFGTLAADVVPTTSGFPSDDDEFDLDSPTEGFSSVPEAIEDIRQGKMVLVTDDEDRENEGDLVMAASKATPEAMAFFVKHGTGIVCVSMVEEDLERLQLPLMVNDKKNEEKLCTAFTVSVDAKHGTTTGVSAHDRATTVLALASRDSKPEDFNRPGHIFPLKYREGGVLKRAGHTEASVDLAKLAGLDPVGVICEVVDSDGSMARLPRLRQFAKEHNLKITSVADLIRYRRKRDQLVEHSSAARIPTMWGPFTAHCFKSVIDGIEHIAMVKGRGIGLGHKLRAYNLQDAGRDTVEANEELGLPVDSREYGVGAQILRDLGVRTMKLMTNNPAKYSGLKGYGLAISGRVPLLTPITKDNKRYLETKRAKMGHMYGLNLIRPTSSTSPTNGKPNTENTSTVQNSNVSVLGN